MENQVLPKMSEMMEHVRLLAWRFVSFVTTSMSMPCPAAAAAVRPAHFFDVNLDGEAREEGDIYAVAMGNKFGASACSSRRTTGAHRSRTRTSS